MTLASPLTLPCGATLPNRIAKSAMSEQIADRHGSPTDTLERLYAAWAAGGAGLLITGNVMIDRRALVEPRNVILEDDRHLDAVRAWADATHAAGDTRLWMQINHPGRVAVTPLTRRPVGPSALRSGVPGYNLRPVRALSREEIAELVRRYATTAQLAIAAGFDGVQVHAAHGYLLSQFLSPLANRRDDEYGGDAERRRRMLLEVIAAVRDAVGPDVPVGVKLNSADFQRGGLQADESIAIAAALEEAGVDLLEISGGTYEAPAMQGFARASTKAREAYFLDYAEQVRKHTTVPLMLTGGLRTAAFMQDTIAGGAIDVAGLARPLAARPDYPAAVLRGEDPGAIPRAMQIGYAPIDAYVGLAWHAAQFRRIAAGLPPERSANPIKTLVGAGARITAMALTQA